MFNHYSKIERILRSYDGAWYIKRINEPTQAKKFNGETVQYDHYYRVYDLRNNPIKYCKFQQLERFASVMKIDAKDLIIAD